MSIATSWLRSPPPDAAIEITAGRISAASVAPRGDGWTIRKHAVGSLPPGAVEPSLTSQNITDQRAVVEALRGVLREIDEAPRRVALVVPDLVAKVSLVRFDQVPGRAEDLEQLIRWQVRKSLPFPIDETVVTYSAGARVDGATEFLVAMARRSVIEEYERVCLEVGAHAGLVDLATLSVLNLFLAQSGVPGGDWLVVHMRPRYTSLVIMRGQDPVFFRNRPDTDGAALSDLVHQTTMYYQDRLSGRGFERVFLGGSGPEPGALERVRHSLEQRLDLVVDTIDPTKVASPADRIQSSPDDLDVLSPLVGMLLRDRARVAA